MSSDSVSLCLIVRNEEKTLPRCVESFRGAFDELVVVDTGSTDNTIEVAKGLGAKVYTMEWKDNFAAARQYAFDMATGDWWLWADADEWLEDGHAPKIRQVIQQMNGASASVAYFKRVVHGFEVMERESLMRRSTGRWVGRVHESFEKRPGLKCVAFPTIVIRHPEIREQSHGRNIRILTEELSQTPRNLFFLATEMLQKGEMQRAASLARAALELQGLGQIERYELLMLLAQAADGGERVSLALQAYSLDPSRREALVFLSINAIQNSRFPAALGYATALVNLPKPDRSIWTLQKSWYGWNGMDLLIHCLRLNKKYKEANQMEVKLRNGKHPNISLIHASRGRPKQMVDCRNLFYARAKNPAMLEHVFVLDKDDEESINAARGYAHEVIDPGGGCVAAWNYGAMRCNGEVVIQVSDDWEPPVGWDEMVMERLKGRIGTESVLAVSDGIDRGGGKQTKCMCMAIMTRARLQAQGHMFYRGYKSVYSDNEFTDRAYEDGVVVEARDIVFKHKHYLTGEAAQDATYKAQNAPDRYRDGEDIYLRRKAARASKAKLDRDYAALMLTTGNGFCRTEVMQRLFDEGVKRIYCCIPNQMWNGTPVENNELFTGAVQRINLDVQKHREPNKDILFTESDVRNEALQAIRSDGWEHVVVVDDDELWMPGTLRKIDDYVSDNHPTSLCLMLVPVVGAPGFPVGGSQDVAMSYLGPSGMFWSSRSAYGVQRVIPSRSVIHFTACRRTREDIAAKMRESGHYGDPKYDFDGWIERTLPNIKPGMKRAHMFTDWDTWPFVREWKAEEWSAIPDSLKPYLGEKK